MIRSVTLAVVSTLLCSGCKPPPATVSQPGTGATPASQAGAASAGGNATAAAPTGGSGAAAIPAGSYRLTITDESDDKRLRKKLVVESPDSKCIVKFGPATETNPEPTGFQPKLDNELKYLVCMANYGVEKTNTRAVKIQYGVGYSFLVPGKELKEGEELMGLPMREIPLDKPPAEAVGFMADGQSIHKIGDSVVLWKDSRMSLALQVTKQ